MSNGRIRFFGTVLLCVFFFRFPLQGKNPVVHFDKSLNGTKQFYTDFTGQLVFFT